MQNTFNKMEQITMNDLTSLLSFLKSAQSGSFSKAAALLGITPAAVSKHIAKIELEFGVRLFRRSTRSISLTEAGEKFYAEALAPTLAIQEAMDRLKEDNLEPSGTLKLSIAPAFGRQYILPLMPEFMERYPAIHIDWSFGNRHVDLVSEGYDAAIGSELKSEANIVARALLPIKILTVAAPAYLEKYGTPQFLSELAQHECIRLRSETSGRIHDWTFLNNHELLTVRVQGRHIFTDQEAICDSAINAVGIARLGAHHALPHLKSGRLIKILDAHVVTTGKIQLYYTHYNLTPRKIRVFIDYLTEKFAANNWLQEVLDA